ncbi:MAG: hypothetical protein PHT02_00720 [Tissierellia bacterium]|nr:hypothetical protein [Tissierellia bacterium]
MNKEEAINYCYLHKNEYLSDLYAYGENGERQFECLIAILEDGTIEPKELKKYGMDY